MLNDVIIRYASVPDTENSEHFFIEQYEVQIISAIRRVLTLSTVYDPVVLSVNIVYTLITSGVITDRASLGKLMQMVKLKSMLLGQALSIRILHSQQLQTYTLLLKLSNDSVKMNQPSFVILN